MKEGHDGSGVGLFLRIWRRSLKNFKTNRSFPHLFHEGIRALDRFMIDLDFMVKYKLSFRPTRPTPAGTPKRDNYVIRVYEYPADWDGLPQDEIQHRLMMIQLQLRAIGEKDQSMLIFSFWPDVIMIKEVGDPLTVADYLGSTARSLGAHHLSQGRRTPTIR